MLQIFVSPEYNTFYNLLLRHQVFYNVQALLVVGQLQSYLSLHFLVGVLITHLVFVLQYGRLYDYIFFYILRSMP